MTRHLKVLASGAATLTFAVAFFGMVHAMTDAASARAASYIAPTYGSAMIVNAEEAL